MVKDLKRIALIVWVVLTIYYILILWINMQNVGMGQAFQDMINQSDRLTLENNLLENEIASKSALNYLDKKAKEMGFRETEKIWYIK